MTEKDPHILKDTEFKPGTPMTRLVQLDADFDTYSERETRARFSTSGVQLITLRTNRKPKTFDLIAAELDALAEAWTQYKYDLAVAEQKELDRQVTVLQEAMQLAETIDGLMIEAREDDYNGRHWIVKHQWLSFDDFNHGYAGTVDYLLKSIKQVKEQFDAEQQKVQEAREIAATIEGANVGSLGKGLYKLSFAGRWSHCDLEGAYAYAVLERLELIQRDLQREADKAAHDQVLINEAKVLAEKIGLSVTREEGVDYWTLNHPVYHAAMPKHLVHPDNANQLLHQVKHIAKWLEQNQPAETTPLS